MPGSGPSLCATSSTSGARASTTCSFELPAAPAAYAVELARGVEEHRDEIDALISKFADRWSIDRMPVIDRNLLRIAVYELGWRPEIPLGVAISEAVDLAKRYSTDDSGRFVNGMLGRIGEHLREIRGTLPGPRAAMGPLETPTVVEPDIDETVDVARPWVVVVWNDPINLMSYVVYVFQKLFGYSKEKATKLMLDVHHKGKAAVSSGNREKAETDVSRLHAHGLWATMERD